MQLIQEKLDELPDQLREEALEFIDSLRKKHSKQKYQNELEDRDHWKQFSQKSVDKIWDNEENDIYNEIICSEYL